MFNLPWHKPQPTRAVAPETAPACATDPYHTGSCGWFDSSHELRCGLLVREHDSVETLAAVLPLVHWLDMHLATGQPQQAQSWAHPAG